MNRSMDGGFYNSMEQPYSRSNIPSKKLSVAGTSAYESFKRLTRSYWETDKVETSDEVIRTAYNTYFKMVQE